MAEWTEEITHIAGTDLAMIKGGKGKPLLVLHEELGHPGWMSYHQELAKDRSLIIPIQPGYGKSPRLEAIRNVHELGLFYIRMLNEMNLAPIDVVGFSLGGWAAAEAASANSKIFRKMVLVAPSGIKPAEGEILDIFAVTIGTQVNATVHDAAAAPEFRKLYGRCEGSLVSDFHKQPGDLGRREFFADAFAAIASRQRPALVDMLGGNIDLAVDSMTTLWPVDYIYFDVFLLLACGVLAEMPWLASRRSTSSLVRVWIVTAAKSPSQSCGPPLSQTERVATKLPGIRYVCIGSASLAV